ncbi:MAG: MoaD/ThiS family protein [Desulfurococcales archaeon]|nr:MoaD/ThiS family protein [Desulfurococcales archaeon]
MEECGKVKLKLLGYLAEVMGGREKEVEICGERRVADLINAPDIDLEELVILINGRGARPEAKVKPEDTVTILPHISGGDRLS